MIRYFAAHPTAANLIMAFFIVIGLVSIPKLQRETFPRIEPNMVEVSVIYPGARAEDVEEGICQRIEDALDTINDIEEVVCEAKEGLGRAQVEMVEGSDLDRLTADVRTEVEAIDDFPEQAEKPTVRQLGRTDLVASVAVTGIPDKANLKNYAEALKRRMLRWGGIPKVEVKGFSERQIRIELEDSTLRQFGLSVADIADTIQRQSLDLPSGSIETQDREFLIRFVDERKSIHDFLDLVVVSGEGGGEIRLGDIARITDTFDLDEESVTFNGMPAAILEITKTHNQDSLTIVDTLEAFLDHERQSMPPGISLEITSDLSSIVRDRLQLLLKNGAQGLALVFAALWLFFGLRYSFWVALGLPVSFLGAIALMTVAGLSINMLSMVGLLIVIGILMDDAIVIAENVAAHHDRGKTPLEAVVDGARQVLPSVFASFATTACIFSSLAFLEGDLGQILRVIPMVMLFVLVVSLVEAFLVLPNHLKHALSHEAKGKMAVQRRMANGLTWVADNWIEPLAEKAVAWRYFTVGLAVALLVLSVAALAGGFLKFSAFPDLEGDVIEARILLPQGTPLARTEEVVDHLEQALRQAETDLVEAVPGDAGLVRNITVQYNKNNDAHESGPHVATIGIDLLESGLRTARIGDILNRWREEAGELPDVLSVNYQEAQLGPAGLAIDMRLMGDDLEELKEASLRLQDWLKGYEGTFNISDDLRPGKPEMRLRLREGAATLGLDSRMIADQLRSAFFGTTVSEIQARGDSFEIDVRLDPRDKSSLADLDYFTISTPDGNLVPLSVAAELDVGRGISRINRVDGVRTVTIQGDLDPQVTNLNEILAHTQANFFPQFVADFPDITINLKGESEEAATTQRSMLTGFILGLAGVFMLLSFQFRSFVEPVVVMVIIPFAFIGAVVGHMVMGLDLTMPSLLGFVSLAGIVVNDSILLVNFIKYHHGTEGTVAAAAPKASRARFRAILLTSLTTVVGLLPILFETDLQAQILIPLVTSLAFGMVAATFLVLFLVPAFYTILDDFGLTTISEDRESLPAKSA